MSWCIIQSIGVVNGLLKMRFSHVGCGPHDRAVRVWCSDDVLLLEWCFQDFFIVFKCFYMGVCACVFVG